MNATYRIQSLGDLLQVPAEKRSACLREIEYALALHELAFGEQAAETPITAVQWADDGNRHIEIQDGAGQQVLGLQIEDTKDPKQQAGEPEIPVLNQLAALGAWALMTHRNDGEPGDVDGASIQDRALELGLLQSRAVAQACGDACACAGFVDFPTQCLFIPDDVQIAARSLNDPSQKDPEK